jgi:hypothetical protein
MADNIKPIVSSATELILIRGDQIEAFKRAMRAAGISYTFMVPEHSISDEQPKTNLGDQSEVVSASKPTITAPADQVKVTPLEQAKATPADQVKTSSPSSNNFSSLSEVDLTPVGGRTHDWSDEEAANRSPFINRGLSAPTFSTSDDSYGGSSDSRRGSEAGSESFKDGNEADTPASNRSTSPAPKVRSDDLSHLINKGEPIRHGKSGSNIDRPRPADESNYDNRRKFAPNAASSKPVNMARSASPNRNASPSSPPSAPQRPRNYSFNYSKDKREPLRSPSNNRQQHLDNQANIMPALPVPMPTLPDNRQTQLCRHYERNRYCNRGDNCLFAHGEGQLRVPVKVTVYMKQEDITNEERVVGKDNKDKFLSDHDQ